MEDPVPVLFLCNRALHAGKGQSASVAYCCVGRPEADSEKEYVTLTSEPGTEVIFPALSDDQSGGDKTDRTELIIEAPSAPRARPPRLSISIRTRARRRGATGTASVELP
jgi:hypothetical protein